MDKPIRERHMELEYPALLLAERKQELARLDESQPDFLSCRRSLEMAICELSSLLGAARHSVTNAESEKRSKSSLAVQYVVDIAQGLVTTQFTGLVRHLDYSEYLTRLRSDPVFNRNFAELIRFSEGVDIRLHFMDFVCDRDPFSETSRRAIVVPSDQTAIYGIARMFQLAKHEPPNIRIFSIIEEAEAWLGIA